MLRKNYKRFLSLLVLNIYFFCSDHAFLLRKDLRTRLETRYAVFERKVVISSETYNIHSHIFSLERIPPLVTRDYSLEGSLLESRFFQDRNQK